MKHNVFVWRSTHTGDFDKFNLRALQSCPFCRTDTGPAVFREFQTVSWWERSNCPLCGWWYEKHDLFSKGVYKKSELTEPCLTSLDINSPKLAIEELGTHLKRNYSDVYSLSPRRFEQLVCDVFIRNGHDAVLTQQTRDGGVDIILTRNSEGNSFSIVECKRYAKIRKIGVKAVRLLLGTAIDWEAQRAFLVTSSNFSAFAFNKSKELRERGYEIDLVSASELLKMLQVYNESMPRLDKLTAEMRREIAISNRNES